MTVLRMRYQRPRAVFTAIAVVAGAFVGVGAAASVSLGAAGASTGPAPTYLTASNYGLSVSYSTNASIVSAISSGFGASNT
jgi:hypothetical protein